jgi:hypothetical protein
MVKVVEKINGDKYFDTEGVHYTLKMERKERATIAALVEVLFTPSFGESKF